MKISNSVILCFAKNTISKNTFFLQQFHNWSSYIRSKNFDGSEPHEMQILRVDNSEEDVPVDEEDETSV